MGIGGCGGQGQGCRAVGMGYVGERDTGLRGSGDRGTGVWGSRDRGMWGTGIWGAGHCDHSGGQKVGGVGWRGRLCCGIGG